MSLNKALKYLPISVLLTFETLKKNLKYVYFPCNIFTIVQYWIPLISYTNYVKNSEVCLKNKMFVSKRNQKHVKV